MRVILGVKDGSGDSDFEVEIKEIPILLKKLKSKKDFLIFQTELVSLEFHYLNPDVLGIEIFDERVEFWANDEVDSAIAEKIVEIVDRNEDFSDFIPMTDRQWAAFNRQERANSDFENPVVI